jgi:type IV pilus assembly protein PilC
MADLDEKIWARKAQCSSRDLVIATRQLEALLNGGLMIANAFEILQQQTENPTLARAFGLISAWLSSGRTLSHSLTFFPKIFSPMYSSMVQVGEETGKLHAVFDKLAIFLEQESKVARSLKSALSYPFLVLGLTALLTLGVFTTILPRFAEIFSEMKLELPLITRFVMAGTYLACNPVFWVFVAVLSALSFGLWRYIQTNAPLMDELGRIALALPVVGGILRDGSVARYCSAMSVLLGCGVRLLTALGIAGRTTGNVVYDRASLRAEAAVREGESLHSWIQQEPLLFPSTVAQLVLAAEESGGMAEVFEKLAAYYEQEVGHKVASFGAALEPILLAVISAVVGTILVSIFLPLYSFIGNLS